METQSNSEIAHNRKETTANIAAAFLKTKTCTETQAIEFADTLIGKVEALPHCFYKIAFDSTKKHKDIKRGKAKGAAYKALESVAALQQHNLKDLQGHNIETHLKMEMQKQLGFSFGLDEIVLFLEQFEERANAEPPPKLPSQGYSIAYYVAQFYYGRTGKHPKTSNDGSASPSAYRIICENLAKYLGLKIGTKIMRRACNDLKE